MCFGESGFRQFPQPQGYGMEGAGNASLRQSLPAPTVDVSQARAPISPISPITPGGLPGGGVGGIGVIGGDGGGGFDLPVHPEIGWPWNLYTD